MLLLQYLARHAEERNDRATAALLRQKIQKAERRAALVRQAAIGEDPLNADALHPEPGAGKEA